MFDTTDTDNNVFDSNLVSASFDLSNEAYGLETAQNTSDSISYLEGTFRADSFAIASDVELTVISGNGNLDYGIGFYDTLDLSDISVDEIISASFADTLDGGVVFDPGNGERVFDYLELADGNQILFEGIDGVMFADHFEDLSVSTNDSYFSQQWNLHMMGVQNAWRMTQGSDDVLVGVQDTGLGVGADGSFHPDFSDRDVYGLAGNYTDEFFYEAGSSSQASLTSHGTSVHGIIAAESNNGLGIAGINWNSDVYNIDILEGNTGDLSLAQATEEMIAFAGDRGQNLVINMSIQTLESFGVLPAEHGEFQAVVAENPNVLFVIASGNSGHQGIEGLSAPAVLAQAYDNVIAVGASWGMSDEFGFATTPGERISYEGYWGSQYGEGLTLTAPSEVWTTNANNDGTFDYFGQFNGTSAATPNVSGVASLIWSANSELTAAEVKQILSETATDIGQVGYDTVNGHGFINADAAVRRAIALSRTNSSDS